MRGVRDGACVTTLVIALLAMVSARQGAPERAPGPEIDFAAIGEDGLPVADLQRSEIEIRVADRVRTVRSLRRITAARATLAGDRSIPPPFGTNDRVAAGRTFALVVDQESLTTTHQPLLRNAVEGLLAELTAADRVMLAALPFGGIQLGFTSDTVRVRQAVQSLTAQGSRGETGSELACRTRRFLESLDGLLQTFAGRQSPLTVVLFTGGLAAPRRDAPMALAPGICELPVGHFDRIIASASAARANVYIAQPADVGLGVTAPRPENVAGGTYRGSDNPLEGIEHLAGATNAARLPLDALGTDSLLRVARESASYYVAELEPVSGEVFGRSRALNVRVTGRGVTVRARPSIILVTGGSAVPTKLTTAAVLASPDPFPDVRLRVGGYVVREPDGRLRVGVLLEPDDAAASLASAGAALIAPDGTIAGRWFARDASERPLLGAIAVTPGTYRLRAAAIDAQGRAGAAEDIVEAALVPIGPLSLGSLVLGLSREGSVRPQLQFGAEPVAIASFDIYGGSAGLSLTAKLELARSADGPALASVPLALTRADESRVTATGAVPIGALSPGDYVVRGAIALADGTSGRVTRTLRKIGPPQRPSPAPR